MPGRYELYRIVLRTHLGSAWATPLPVVEFATTFDADQVPVTAMTVCVADQAELIGLVNEFHGYGLNLLSLSLLGDTGEQAAT